MTRKSAMSTWILQTKQPRKLPDCNEKAASDLFTAQRKFKMQSDYLNSSFKHIFAQAFNEVRDNRRASADALHEQLADVAIL